MASYVGLVDALRLRYSYEKFLWLITTISGMSILTFSAQELWAIEGVSLCYQVNLPMFYLYVIFFVSIIFYTSVKNFQRICEGKAAIFCAFMSIIFDLVLLSLYEFFLLLIINQLATNLLSQFVSIFLIALPFCLGELTLSSLTFEYLKKREEKLRNEIGNLKKEIPRLLKQIDEEKRELKELEKKRTDLKKLFSKNREDLGERNER